MELGDSVQSGLITARTILFANVGRLPGGVVLLPDAQIDDGFLDVAVIDTRGGLIGWADLLRKVTLQGLGIRKDLVPYSTGSIHFRRTQEVVVRTEEPEHVQVDGDLVGVRDDDLRPRGEGRPRRPDRVTRPQRGPARQPSAALRRRRRPARRSRTHSRAARKSASWVPGRRCGRWPSARG